MTGNELRMRNESPDGVVLSDAKTYLDQIGRPWFQLTELALNANGSYEGSTLSGLTNGSNDNLNIQPMDAAQAELGFQLSDPSLRPSPESYASMGPVTDDRRDANPGGWLYATSSLQWGSDNVLLPERYGKQPAADTTPSF